MIYFTSNHRVQNLSLFKKVWMAPVAHMLKGAAVFLIYLTDKFNAQVMTDILNCPKCDGGGTK
ncbi:hypothetical protein ACQKEX_15065 [Bacillus pumilus]|uniref:hypothetical protein n=1 Tax=Bacillus TaxID=1386 RepID=UPI000967EF7F|nr:hypothetical protein [Bacillus pumilus]MBU8576347.1 hypothetical protein [Bacillus pumilus]OLP64316.1 hypothetical protein BACPU_25410 [Bacillus pumilus]TYS40434.1 hypothetical protein FZC68_16630 [Bacillus pumilus]